MPISKLNYVHLEHGRLAPDYAPADVSALIDEALTDPKPAGLVIHFHGGLVDHAAGMQIAERLLPGYRDAGQAYPVFFVWESGLIEVIQNRLRAIAQENIFVRIWERVSEFVMRRFRQAPGARGGATLPPLPDPEEVWQGIRDALAQGDDAALPLAALPAVPEQVELSPEEQRSLEAELAQDPILQREIQRISNGMRTPDEIAADRGKRSSQIRGSTETLMDPDALEELVERPTPGARGLLTSAKVLKLVAEITARVLTRYARRRDHGLHATIVEEILRALYLGNVGKFVWDLIKADTGEAFGPDPALHGGTAFLHALRDKIGSDQPPPITLVGHSTGAIYISEFLEAAAAVLPPSTRFGVVLLAPASTFEKTASTMAQHADKISGFRMFTMTDAYEQADKLVPVVYPHSLLYFVSGLLEDEADKPIVGMQRFYDGGHFEPSKFPSVGRVRDYVGADPARTVWSVDTGGDPGKKSASEKHGDFDDDQTTLDSMAHILSQGF